MDVAVHLGTLLAVVVYFRRDVLGLGRGLGRLATGRADAETRLAFYILAATVPVLAAGYVVKTQFGVALRTIEVIGWATLGFGALLWAADRWGARVKTVAGMTLGPALLIGCAQVLALVPGTSRSGITMTAARALGFERAEAARFSLLMAMPVILAAALLAGLDLARTGDVRLTADAALAAALAFVSALAAIAALMRWLTRASFTPFVIYRLILGLGLLAAVYGFGIDATAATDSCAG